MVGLRSVVRRLHEIAAVALVSMACPANAEKINLRTATCAQLSDWKSEDRYDVFVFLFGYYGGMTKSESIDDETIEPFAKKFERWCSKNPSATMLDSIPAVVAAP